MKKTKKVLASLAIAGMTLSMLPFNAFAASTVPTRLAGGTAAQTAVAIAEQTGWTGTAILASSASYGMVDALTSGPLATFLKAPILLQEPGAVLNADTKAELTKLNVTKVYVTSGTSVISQAVLDQLKGMGITVESLGGADRFETSVNIAKKMVALGAPVSKVAVAYGWLNQDALSIASIASASSSPILLTEKNALPASVQAFLSANTSVTASDVIGGTGVISDAVKAALPNATRHAGNTAYDTNNQVIQDFNSALTYGNVFVASGVTGIDALAGAPLAAVSKSAIVLTDGTVPATATFVHSKLTADSVVTALGGTAVVPEAVSDAVRTGVVTPNPGALSVTSVSAASAASFKVVFNQAPADTSKVTFTVQRSTTPVTTTTTWNAAKTEATVSSASDLPEGSYTVAVKNDTTDLGTSTVAISAQKIAKINITSTKLSVTSANIGYATYNVLDQYGTDITTSSLANSVNFQSGAGTVTASKGLLKVNPGVNGQKLIQFPTVIITGYDSTSGASTNATLTTSTVLGTLSNMTLNTLTNADGKVLTDGDTTSVFYVDYTATDVSGNATKDYDMVVNGLITNTINNLDNCLSSSNSNVLAQVVADPSDSSKAAIKVTVVGNSNLSADLPVTITAMSYSGTTSTLNLTLKKAATLDTFTLMAPAYDIAAGDSKEIPFTAYDQNGKALTKASDITGVVFSNNISTSTKADGTLKLTFTPGSVTGPQVITATTSTGKYSSLTIDVQKTAVADTLSLDSSVLKSVIQATKNTGTDTNPVYTTTAGAAVQHVDFGYDKGGLSVKDQYGRAIDMTTISAKSNQYKVVASSSDETVVSTAGDFATTGQHEISLTALKPGSATVTFKLYSSATTNPDGTARDASVAIDTKSQTFTVVQNSDIKDYTIDTVASPIYTTSTDSTITPSQADYKANPKVYGETALGAKVLLSGTPIIGASVDSTDFTIFTGTNTVYANTAVAYNAIKVSAKTLSDSTKKGSSTTLSVTVLGADGNIHAVSTPITSTTESPNPVSIDAVVDTSVAGLSRSGDIITLTEAPGRTYADILGANPTLAKYNAAGTKQSVYLAPTDQYGSTSSALSQILVVGTTPNFAINSDGSIKSLGVNGDNVKISGVTINGLVKTIEIDFR